MKQTYRSDIKVGDRYVDVQSGIEGVCISLVFFQHGCERACLESTKDGALLEHYFDAARLRHADTSERATTKRPGGTSNPPSRSKRA